MKRYTNIQKKAVVLSLLACFMLWGSPLLLQAQQVGDGSLYSRFGLGDLFNFESSQIQGMGGGGTALTSLNYVNLGNPATWADQQLTRLAGSVLFQGIEISDATGEASRLNSSQLQAFQFSFPLKPGKLGAVVMYSPYTRVAHRVQRSQVEVINDPTLVNPTAYTISFVGSGGLQKARVGLGYRASRSFSLGASADFTFGILEEIRNTEFNTGELVRTSLTNSTRLAGFSATLGGLFSIPKVLNERDAVSIGVSIGTPATLNGTQVLTNVVGSRSDTLGTTLKGDVSLPINTNIGLSYYANAKWTFVANYSYEPWSDFDSDLGIPGYIPGESSFLDDRRRFSFGASYVGSNNPLDSYFRRVGFRLGFYNDSGYINLGNNEDLNTTAVTGGISLPTLFPGTRVDINVELGRRGTTNQNLVRESFFKFHVNVNIGERWFERRKLG